MPGKHRNWNIICPERAVLSGSKKKNNEFERFCDLSFVPRGTPLPFLMLSNGEFVLTYELHGPTTSTTTWSDVEVGFTFQSPLFFGKEVPVRSGQVRLGCVGLGGRASQSSWMWHLKENLQQHCRKLNPHLLLGEALDDVWFSCRAGLDTHPTRKNRDNDSGRDGWCYSKMHTWETGWDVDWIHVALKVVMHI
jgi:hypothetical protein